MQFSSTSLPRGGIAAASCPVLRPMAYLRLLLDSHPATGPDPLGCAARPREQAGRCLKSETLSAERLMVL